MWVTGHPRQPHLGRGSTVSPRPAAYWFSVPSLPKEWYKTVQESRDAYDLTQWQVIILALACLRSLHHDRADHVKDLAAQVKETYHGE